jgi:predicted hydrolase (HD superfamily)
VAVPGRREAAALLLELDPPPWFVTHVSAVAEVAAFLARRLTERGVPVDRRRVEAAALLHDVDKVIWTKKTRPGPHGEVGGRWLAERGHPELERPVAAHPVTLLTDEARYARWLDGADAETRIVAYADKRAGQHLEPMSSRFGGWRKRHPEYAADLERAWARARELERSVCRDAGIEPEGVGRLSWVGRALRDARR